MKEEFLHYIWKHSLYNHPLKTDEGDEIEVVSTGNKNSDAGPDFLNARVRIGSTLWAGNIEIHTDSADWNRHKHHKDASYNNVILHVVFRHTRDAIRENGEKVPTLLLSFEPCLFDHYSELLKSELSIPCQENLPKVPHFTWSMWLESLSIERIEEKTDYIKDIFRQCNSSWEETFYIILAKNFGFKLNALPFEMLAKATPLKVLSKYANNSIKLEALLFGQAGFLEESFSEPFPQKLKEEYQHLQNAHKLNPIENSMWKFLRSRPANFPTVRIAQFAALINVSAHLFSKVMECRNIQELRILFEAKPSQYWDEHYTFTKTSAKQSKKLGKTAIEGILINTVLPFMFVYGKLRGKEELSEKSLTILNEMPTEKNSIIDVWRNIGLEPKNAGESQALLQLKNNYCNFKNCLYCQVGNEIIRNNQK